MAAVYPAFVRPSLGRDAQSLHHAHDQPGPNDLATKRAHPTDPRHPRAAWLSSCSARQNRDRPTSTDILGNDAVREDQFLRFIVSLDISKENSVSISSKNPPDSATDFHSLAKPHAHIALIISPGIHPFP